MGTIFISHVISDAPLMEEIAQGLEAAGYTAWYFERDVLPGTSYLIQITQAIECCDALILLVTPQTLESDQVTKEVVGAFERRIPFFPVLVNVTPPELKERQPEWRHALGGTAMLVVGEEGLSSCLPRIVDGLASMGISPSEEKAVPFSPILQTPAAFAPPHLKDRILSTRSSLEGERKQVTVLFADVVGFTPLSEKMDPEEVGDLIRPAIDIMAEEIHRYEGTIAQFLGDGLMALFGAPLAHEDAPHRALYSALAIQRRLGAYGRELESRGISFKMRIGVNTGLVIVGRIGDDLTMEYTALGDTVNMASRMESSAEPGTVQIAENTYRLTQGYFDFFDLGEITVKGKEEPVHAYRVLGILPARGRISASLARGLSPFVGREKELDQLSDRYHQAREGSGQVVGIVGEPGVGKSRLLLQFRELLPEGEYTYLEGGCIHYGEAIAYLPILDILRSYFAIHEGEKGEASKRKMEHKLSSLGGHLQDILPPLQELLSLEVEDQGYLNLQPAQRRERIFEAIRHLLVAESQTHPLILALEDLHRIDRTTEEFLTYFIEGLPAASILLILLYRPEYIPEWVSKTFYSQIRVDHLPEQPSTELVEVILSEGEVSPDLSDFIVDRTAGNPLFIEEFTRGLLEAGSIQRDDARYVLSTPPTDIQVPDTIQGIIASRLDRLPEELKEIMQIAAVIGREFSFRLLEEVAGQGKVLKSYLMQLQSLEFVYEQSLFPEPEYIFKHALTQEVAYESLLLKKRREMHERIGRAIEELYPDRLEDHYETLAYHYSTSDNPEKTLTYLKLSGEKATKSYSDWEAIRFYREAIRLLDALPETDERKKEKINVFISMAIPLVALNLHEEGVEILEEAERLAEELEDEESLLAVYNKLSFCHSLRGDVLLGMEYSEKCFKKAENMGAIDCMLEVAPDICNARLFAGGVEEVVEISQRILSLFEERGGEGDILAGRRTVFSRMCGWCGMALVFLGKFGEAQIVLEKGLEKACEINYVFGVAWLELSYSFLSLGKGDGNAAVDHSRKAIEHLEEIGLEIFLGIAWSYLGHGYLFLDKLEKAKSNVEKGLRLQKEAGTPILLPWIYVHSAMIEMGIGNIESARKSSEEALRLSQEFKTTPTEAYARIVLGSVIGEADPSQIDVAERQIHRGLLMADEMKLKPMSAQGHLSLGELFANAGRWEEAIENLRRAEEMYRDMGVGPKSYWLTRTQKAMARPAR